MVEVWARPADEAQMIFEFGKKKAEEHFVELLKARICFDFKAGKCEHASCYNNAQLIVLVENGL